MLNSDNVSVCASCKRIAIVKLCEYIEPHKNPAGVGDDVCGHVIAAMCDHCQIVHWAWELTTLDSVAKEATEWADKQFGTGREKCVGAVAHLKTEVDELEKDPYDPVEQADCFLLIVNAAHRAGNKLAEAAAAKLKVNKERKWGPQNERGFSEHIRDDQA